MVFARQAVWGALMQGVPTMPPTQGKMHLYLKPMVQDCALEKWGTAEALRARIADREAVRHVCVTVWRSGQ